MEHQTKEDERKKFIEDENIRTYLLETSKWAKVLSILGFVGTGIILLISLLLIIKSTSFSAQIQNPKLMGILYFIFSIVYLFPIYYTYQFSTKIKRGITDEDSNKVVVGIKNLKSLFKFIGIMTVSLLIIYGIIVLIAIPYLLILKNT